MDLHQFSATIVLNESLAPAWKLLGFLWPDTFSQPRPGQFFSFLPRALEPGDSGLLRRPLAFAGFRGGIAFAIYQIKGRGTRALANASPRDSADIIGPLGRGFVLPEAGSEEALRRPLIIGGGVGMGPLLFLDSLLPQAALHLGFRTASAIPLLSQGLKARPELGEISGSLARARIATDDGSAGFHGTVVDSLVSELDAALKNPGACPAADGPMIFACGPGPMLAAIAGVAETRGVPTQVSVEQWMACGVGACQGCAVPLRSGGYARACSDGPVFDSRLIDWGAWR